MQRKMFCMLMDTEHHTDTRAADAKVLAAKTRVRARGTIKEPSPQQRSAAGSEHAHFSRSGFEMKSSRWRRNARTESVLRACRRLPLDL